MVDGLGLQSFALAVGVGVVVGVFETGVADVCLAVTALAWGCSLHAARTCLLPHHGRRTMAAMHVCCVRVRVSLCRPCSSHHASSVSKLPPSLLLPLPLPVLVLVLVLHLPSSFPVVRVEKPLVASPAIRCPGAQVTNPAGRLISAIKIIIPVAGQARCPFGRGMRLPDMSALASAGSLAGGQWQPRLRLIMTPPSRVHGLPNRSKRPTASARTPTARSPFAPTALWPSSALAHGRLPCLPLLTGQMPISPSMTPSFQSPKSSPDMTSAAALPLTLRIVSPPPTSWIPESQAMVRVGAGNGARLERERC